jgi:hypothetical protein
MATKTAKSSPKSNSRPANQSKRGGARSGSGRKPKPITTLMAVLKTPADTTGRIKLATRYGVDTLAGH